MGKMYRWQVILGDQMRYVHAMNRLEATKEAARQMGVRWSECARDMSAIRMGRA